MNGEVSIDARIRRWSRALGPDGPADHLFIVQYGIEPPDRPPLWPSKHAERIDWALRKHDALHDRLTWLHDDHVPYLDMFTGTEIFAEALGCEVYRPDADMPAARPCIATAADAAGVRVPDVFDSPLAGLFDMADALRVRGGNAPLRLPDIQSPMDIAAMMWDKADFFTALLTEPAAVRALAAKARALLCAFLDAWFARYGEAFVAHYPDYYMPRGVSLSEDEVGSVSAEHFEAFFLPELTALSERYGALGIHCCADSRHQWPGFQRVPGLRLLNLHQPPPVLREAYKTFAGGPLQMHSPCLAQPPWSWPDQLPPGARACFLVPADSRAAAVETAGRMREACGREQG